MKKFNFKTIKKLFFVLLILCGCVINNDCLAADKPTLTFEQLTKKYPSMVEYAINTRRGIKGNWYPPAASFENTAIIILTINKDGKLENCYLSSPSPDDGFNEALINAARKTKYAPLPEEVKENSVDLDMEFSMKRRTILKNN